MSRLLRREEIILLRNKYLADVHGAYVKMTGDVNKLATRIALDDDEEIWLSEKQQRKLVRKLYKDWRIMNKANNRLKSYLKRVLRRLNENIPDDP